jgi:hypothetical protein
MSNTTTKEPPFKDTLMPGSMVEWTSHANGKSKTKVGNVVAIVPKGTTPLQALDADGFRIEEFENTITREKLSQCRLSTSFLIAVRKEKGKPLLYWPHSGVLKPPTRSTVETETESV